MQKKGRQSKQEAGRRSDSSEQQIVLRLPNVRNDIDSQVMRETNNAIALGACPRQKIPSLWLSQIAVPMPSAAQRKGMTRFLREVVNIGSKILSECHKDLPICIFVIKYLGCK